jgi:hypothetical protein
MTTENDIKNDDVKKHVYLVLNDNGLPAINFENVTTVELIGMLESALFIIKHQHIEQIMLKNMLATAFN